MIGVADDSAPHYPQHVPTAGQSQLEADQYLLQQLQDWSVTTSPQAGSPASLCSRDQMEKALHSQRLQVSISSAQRMELGSLRRQLEELQQADSNRLALQEELRSRSAQHKADIAALLRANAALQEQLEMEQASSAKLWTEMKALRQDSRDIASKGGAALASLSERQNMDMCLLQQHMQEPDRANGTVCGRSAQIHNLRKATIPIQGSESSRQRQTSRTPDGELTPRSGFAAAMAGIAKAAGLEYSNPAWADPRWENKRLMGAVALAAEPSEESRRQLQDDSGGSIATGSGQNRVAEGVPPGVQLGSLAEDATAEVTAKPATRTSSRSSRQLCRVPSGSPKMTTPAAGVKAVSNVDMGSPGASIQKGRPGSASQRAWKPKSPLSGSVRGNGGPADSGSSTPSKTLRYGKPLMMMGDFGDKENSPSGKNTLL